MSQAKVSATEDAAAWDVLADAYDHFTAFHDHGAWARQLDDLLRDAGFGGGHVLDVGCGTGSSTAAIRALGYTVSGVDISASMLAQAAQRLGADVPLHQADMRALPQLGAFDAIWCVSDGVNFLLGEQELVDTFAGFHRNLAPGGLVIFDADTLLAFRTLYTSLLVMPGADRVVIFDGRAEAPPRAGQIAEATIECLTRSATPPWWERVSAPHRQRHHPPETVVRALGAAELELVVLWGTDGSGGSDRPLAEERHNKAVYIAQRTALD